MKFVVKVGETVTVAEKVTSNRRTTDWTANDPSSAVELHPRDDGGIDVVAVAQSYVPAIIYGNGDAMASITVKSD